MESSLPSQFLFLLYKASDLYRHFIINLLTHHKLNRNNNKSSLTNKNQALEQQLINKQRLYVISSLHV